MICRQYPVCAGIPVAGGALPRPQDAIWLISTRQSGCSVPGAGCEPNLTFCHFESVDDANPGRWRRADRTAFLGQEPLTATTIFFVHGNRVSRSEAYRRGLAVYRALVRHARGNRPIRFVIWSWPTARLRGLANDVRVKACRAGPAGYRLAWLVDQMDSQTPIGMVGFSLGARVVTGALHILGGGRLGQLSLPARHDAGGASVRTVLMTAALDNDWLLPGRHHGRALSQTDRMLLLNNSCDRALRWYHMIDRCRRPTALGRWGIASFCALGANAQKIDQCDVGCQLGRVHSLQGYLCRPNLTRRAWSYVSFETRDAANEHAMTDRSVE